MARMGTEAAFAVYARARELEAAGRDVVHLEMGQPGFATPAHIVEAGIRALSDGHTGYTPAAGLPALREALAADVRRTRGLQARPEQVVVLPGAKAGIFFTFLALVERGDEVLLPDPGFPIFASMADAVGARRVTYAAGAGKAERPALNEIARRLGPRTRLLVLNSPCNPTGVVYRPDELEWIADRCRRHDVWILSDEVYSEIRFGPPHLSIAALDGMEERTILLDGFSKTFCMTGWRLGYVCLPRTLVPLFEKLMVNSASCAVSFVQHAGLAALAGPREELRSMLSSLEERRRLLVAGLDALPGMRCDLPEGALFAFADARRTGVPAARLAERFLEAAGVACVAGPAFGAGGEGHLRFSFAAPSERIREGLDRLERLLAGLGA